MKRMWKCRLCLLVALLMAALFLPQSLAVQEQPESPTDLTESTTPAAAAAPLQRNADPTIPTYDKALYNEADVNVINNIIENNGLKAQKNAPENWDFADWTTTEPKQVTQLTLPSKRLEGTLDLRGLTALTYLNCYGNQLPELNVSGLTKLTTLWCESTQLTELNVSGCEELRDLRCSRNQLTELNVSGLTKLTELRCEDNQLRGLDVSGLRELTTLWCTDNQLDELNVSGLTKLKTLWCRDNQLTELSVSGLTALTDLSCSNNQLTSLNLIGLSKDIQVSCYRNELTSLTNPDGAILTVDTAPNGIARIVVYGIAKNGAPAPGLVRIEAYPKSGYAFKNWAHGETDNPLYFSLTQNKTVTPYFVEREGDPIYHAGDLAFLENLIQEQQLEGKKGIRLGYPDTYDPVDWQDTPTNKRIIGLFLPDLDLTGELDVHNLTALEVLDCSRNQLTGLNVSGLTALTGLYCSGNQLTSLDVSGFTALTHLYCSGNQLTSLDASRLTQLQDIACMDNPLSSLKLPDGRSVEINVTGSGQPWLYLFYYNSGTPAVWYIPKPDPGYGGEWSENHGCAIDDNELSFNFGNNGRIADVSATLTFTRNAPLSADPNKGEIKGENGLQQDGQVKKGDTVTFTANPITTGAADSYKGDVRYIPDSWKVNPSGTFADKKYTQSFSTEGMALGNHTLTVTYREERFDGTDWQPTSNTIEKAFPFTLVEEVTPPVNPPDGNTPGGNTSGGNTPGGNASGNGQSGNPSGTGASSANPGTGDSGYAWYIVGLALAGGAVVLLVRKKVTA